MSRRRPFRRPQVLVLAALPGMLALSLTAAPAQAAPKAPAKDPVAVGGGGAVSSVDPYATEIGLDVLRRGGNAVDAAVAAAAALGVTEPYSAGIGGGGFFVYYDAGSGRIETIDGRETAPELMEQDAFVEGGVPIPFAEAVTSGLSVGVPGTPATWELALDAWGSIDLRDALRPAARLAHTGFVVDDTFRQQTADNAARFADFTSTRELFLPGGAPPEVGSVFRNRDLAMTYDLIGRSRHRVPVRRGPCRRDRGNGDAAAAGARIHAGRPAGADAAARPGGVRSTAERSDAGRVPRAGGRWHGTTVLRRLDRRRVAEHPRRQRPRCARPGGGAAPLPRVDRTGVRRPQPLRRRR